MPKAPADRPLEGIDALVLGGGIAGLAVAAMLGQRGARVEILERAATIAEVGAGIQISPNGTRVLRAMGIEPADHALRTRRVELRNVRGGLVTLFEPAADPGFFLFHRADLIEVLATAARAAGAGIHLQRQVSSVEAGTDALAIRTADDQTRTAGLVVGADGLHSVLRGALNGEAPPFFTGQVAWRALIPGDDSAPVVQIFMGPGRHLVSYPLRGGTLRNIVAVEERAGWASEGWHHRDAPEALRQAFAMFGGPVPAWLAAVSEPFLWGLFRHPVARRWHDGRGRAALVGDAAHPTLPFMAQGANLALEDAATLVACLSQGRDTPQRALERYQALRADRAAAIVEVANKNARIYHMRPPLAPVAQTGLRLARLMGMRFPFNRFGWIFDHDATAPGA